MTPAQLRKICETFNPGGQTRLAGLLDWTPRTIRNKLSGKTEITKSDELAIRHVMECLHAAGDRS